MIQHPNLDRLESILFQNNYAFWLEEDNMIKTRCYLRLKLKEPVVRDALLKIGELSQSFSVLGMLYNQDSMRYMLQ